MSRKLINILSAVFAVGWNAVLMLVTGYRPWQNITLYFLAALYIFLFLRFFLRMIPRLTRKLNLIVAILVTVGCIFLFDIKFPESFYYDALITAAAEIPYADIRQLAFYGLQFCLIYPIAVFLLYYVLKKRETN
jgi:hypothetical protein